MSTEIICILDGSGSMGAVSEEAKNGFNEFLKEQQSIGPANITIAWFDNNWNIDYEGKLSDAHELEQWKVGGMTALFDAIGKTFHHVKDRFTNEKPEKVILAIQTDGMENASKEFNKEAISALIRDHEEKYGWTVIFLGAGLESAIQAQNIGINPLRTFAYDVNDTQKAFSGTYSTAVADARS